MEGSFVNCKNRNEIIIIIIIIITTTTTTTTTVPGKHEVKELPKTAILGTAHILWKVLM